MCSHVFLKITLMIAPVATLLADIRLRVGVRPLVNAQELRRDEPFVAITADVIELPHVNGPLVLREIVSPAVRFPAGTA